MAVHEETSTFPWNRQFVEPGDLEIGLGCLSGVSGVVAGALAFYGSLGLYIAFVWGQLIGRDASNYGIPGLVALVIGAGLYRRYFRVCERARIAAEWRYLGETDILLLRTGFPWPSLHGRGRIAFREARAELEELPLLAPCAPPPSAEATLCIGAVLGAFFLLPATEHDWPWAHETFQLVLMSGIALILFPVYACSRAARRTR